MTGGQNRTRWLMAWDPNSGSESLGDSSDDGNLKLVSQSDTSRNSRKKMTLDLIAIL